MIRGRVREYHAVESAVDNIAQSAGQDEREAQQQARRSLGLQEVAQIVGQESDSQDAEEAKGELAVLPTQVDAKSHAVVLYKMDERPIQAEDAEFLSIRHVGLYPYLQRLVKGKHQEDER